MNKIKPLISNSDIIIEVVDARFPKDSRIFVLEKYIKKINKKLIIAINKADLVPEDFLLVIKEEFEREFPTVYVSCKTRKGSRRLREVIKENIDENKEKNYVAVVGYPNTGKSSIINLLVGRRKAGVAPIPGFTKGIQLIRLSKKIYLYDTPGVVFPKSEELKVILGIIDPSKVKNPIRSVDFLIKKIQKEAILNAYEIEDFKDTMDLLVKLKEKFNVSRKDWIDFISRRIISDWITGKIKGYWL